MKEKLRYAFHIAYIGSGFKGSQRQPNVKTIEGVFLEALKASDQATEDPDFNFKTCGRTDAGVHALDWVVAFSTSRPPIISWINSNLPKQIRIWGQTAVPKSFHPRFDAISRTYKYVSVIPSQEFNLKSLQAGIKLIQGEHDFTNFATPSKETNSTTCNIFEASTQVLGNVLVFTFTANRFLWHMVRKLVSSLLNLGMGTLTLKEFQGYLKPTSSKRLPQIHLVSPDGLILAKVKYSFEVQPIKEGIQDISKIFRKIWMNSSVRAKLSEVALEEFRKKSD
ncbi:MAG: tRNA pseudouridine(38-40) synthase TruA [Candidatus Ranarchaeia archaeon]|jgi:tRNA pseudouridine38-40 synthase